MAEDDDKKTSQASIPSIVSTIMASTPRDSAYPSWFSDLFRRESIARQILLPMLADNAPIVNACWLNSVLFVLDDDDAWRHYGCAMLRDLRTTFGKESRLNAVRTSYNDTHYSGLFRSEPRPRRFYDGTGEALRSHLLLRAMPYLSKHVPRDDNWERLSYDVDKEGVRIVLERRIIDEMEPDEEGRDLDLKDLASWEDVDPEHFTAFRDILEYLQRNRVRTITIRYEVVDENGEGDRYDEPVFTYVDNVPPEEGVDAVGDTVIDYMENYCTAPVLDVHGGHWTCVIDVEEQTLRFTGVNYNVIERKDVLEVMSDEQQAIDTTDPRSSDGRCQECSRPLIKDKPCEHNQEALLAKQKVYEGYVIDVLRDEWVRRDQLEEELQMGAEHLNPEDLASAFRAYDKIAQGIPIHMISELNEKYADVQAADHWAYTTVIRVQFGCYPYNGDV